MRISRREVGRLGLAAGKPVSQIALAGEDHWLSRAETRERTLEEIGRFLQKHLA